jgi:DNA-binding transcriptional LysR family regulator
MSGVCNLACDYDLWPELGDAFFEQMKRRLPDLAISVWLGSQNDIASWLEDGKADVAFTYRSATSARQDQIVLCPDELKLYATRPDSPIRFNPDYVFIEAGDAFGRDHAAAYADASPTRLSFGNASVGLAYILQEGGSAYLPERIANKHVVAGRLFALKYAPKFTRDVYLTFNKAAHMKWDWFDTLVEDLPRKH